VQDYLADIHRYDATADPAVIERIVRYLGPALRNRKSALVACSEPADLARVAERWCARKLGVNDRQLCERVIALVCETMAGDHFKSRVTFYYLVAKHLGKLEAI
jgi:hypothetical protein